MSRPLAPGKAPQHHPTGYRLLSALCHACTMSYAVDGRSQWPARVREVVENIEPVNGGVGYPTGTVGGPTAPSCYRVSLLSGSLEVTARLKSADDLELLVKVLEANKPLFAKADRLATEVLTLTQEICDPGQPGGTNQIKGLTQQRAKGEAEKVAV